MQHGVIRLWGIPCYREPEGVMRVFKFNQILQQYEALWSYTIPPSYYYGWVTALDISSDGSTLALGSYQPDAASVNHGYLYVFDVVAGPPYVYKSLDFGDMMEAVAVSDTGQIAVGAGWGPYSGTGYDLIAYNTKTRTDEYLMDGSYPGSLFACDISNDGTRIGAGGKLVHARAFGSGGWAYSIELDFVKPVPYSNTSAIIILFVIFSSVILLMRTLLYRQ